MRVVWTKEAQIDLESIYLFWASRNQPYSVRLYNLLIDEAEKLSGFPKIGTLERFLLHRAEQFHRCHTFQMFLFRFGYVYDL